MDNDHISDWLDEREPDDRPSLWDERDPDVAFDPDPDDESWRDEPEEEPDLCGERDFNTVRVCELPRGHDGNHKCGPAQWGREAYAHRQVGGVGWNEPAVLWDGIQERER